MALLSDLVRIVAAVEGLEEVSVGIFASHAREAGLISQGGRGRSAAKMTIVDAANLLIAVNGCQFAKDVPAMTPIFRALKPSEAPKETAVGIAKEGATFGEDLELLLSKFLKQEGERQRADPPGQTFIRFLRPQNKVEIEMRPGFGRSYREEKVTYGVDPQYDLLLAPDRWDETVISDVTLRRVAESL